MATPLHQTHVVKQAAESVMLFEIGCGMTGEYMSIAFTDTKLNESNITNFNVADMCDAYCRTQSCHRFFFISARRMLPGNQSVIAAVA